MVRMRQEYLAYLWGLFSTGQPSAIYVLLCWTQLRLLPYCNTRVPPWRETPPPVYKLGGT